MRSWPTVTLPKIERGQLPPLTLYSSYEKKFVSLSDHDFSMYVCGITPYDATHLGHAATYLTFDLIHRYQLVAGKNVRFVENITDIDDPLLERANRDQIDWRQLAEKEIELFRSDMSALRVLPPAAYIGAVEAIPEVIAAIEELSRRRHTYSIDGDIYLDLQGVKGAIEHLPLSDNEALRIFRERGGDPDRNGKRHPLDTLLWLAERPNEPSWNSPFGNGRPGWHIECAAIALKHLTGNLLNDNSHSNRQTAITLQGGGSDLFFPHHYMSAVQVSALRDQPFASLYVHTGMIGLDGEKMSKSKGNLVFVHKILENGVDPMTLRIALLSDHYATDRMWSRTLLDSAEQLRNDLVRVLSQSECGSTMALQEEICRALANNLDTPAIFSSLRRWVQDQESEDLRESSGILARFMDALLGLAF